MSSIRNTVYYCCVSKGNRIVYCYSCGDNEIENLASLCLERTPPFHSWYFQTIRKKTFGYLMEDEYVYFTIVDEGLGNPGVLQFLQHIRDEFKKVARSTKNGSKGSMSALNSVCLQEQMVPVIKQLISSLEQVAARSGSSWMGENPSSHHPGPSPSPEGNLNSQGEVATSTKMPLLGKPSKQEKKKMKDRVGDIPGGSEEHRGSTDRGIKIDVIATESNNQSPAISTMSLQKGSSSMRIKPSRECARRVWWRQVRIILAIDVVVCLILFGIWLGICHGFSCISG